MYVAICQCIPLPTLHTHFVLSPHLIAAWNSWFDSCLFGRAARTQQEVVMAARFKSANGFPSKKGKNLPMGTLNWSRRELLPLLEAQEFIATVWRIADGYTSIIAEETGARSAGESSYVPQGQDESSEEDHRYASITATGASAPSTSSAGVWASATTWSSRVIASSVADYRWA
jgi:hypothetical protein